VWWSKLEKKTMMHKKTYLFFVNLKKTQPSKSKISQIKIKLQITKALSYMCVCVCVCVVVKTRKKDNDAKKNYLFFL
jgi:hypothetical protein